ncbi:MAG TPA: nucleoside triphosphate pyrophosphohydrolase, partial [Bacteroidales bacterium]|nr:nucleoside triphosphate pyrophosphohydrolase [Bacteroidales bacterium]
MRDELKAFERLLDIMDELRAKCPWDKSQTIESLRYLTIEETYELSESIIRNDMDDVRKELGDLMLHIVFYSKIASEKNAFNITDVLNGICEKLIVRHPHIYGDVKVSNADDVKSNWEKIKLKTGEKSVLAGVPASLPAMVKAYRIQEKVSGVGFDWEKRSQVFDKVMEEANELKNEVENNLSIEKTEQEFGDLIFALINYARYINVNPEDALEKTNIKFIKRFSFIEKKAKESGRRIQELSLAEMDSYWNESKL